MFRTLALAALLAAGLSTAFAQDDFTERSAPDIRLFPFFHGVASGDPLPDAVVIWTRVTTDATGMLPVNWRVATDVNMTNVVRSGAFTTGPARDYTVKVDVTGLSPDTWYYYEFEYLGRRSQIGRTRTAPIAGVDNLRFALASCSNYQAGYFNAYAHIANRNDIDGVIHVGDYIYEYETGGYGFEPALGRTHSPDGEIITLSDYRVRHSWYKLDDASRYVHQMYPFIAIYDDHEFANDAWIGGAENHDSGEGPWETRKSAAFQAWLEWMPVRDPLPSTPTSVYRKLPFGDLLDFFVIDTRIEGRDEQSLSSSSSPSQSLLGEPQFAWLTNELRQSNAQWKVLVNQVMFSPLTFFGIPANSDQWDGYSFERQRLIDSIKGNNIDNFVVLTGDIHTAWSNNIPAPGGNVGVEFVCTSVTSPGLSFGASSLIQFFNPHVRYVNTEEHGYLLMDFNASRAQGDHVFITTKLAIDTSASVASSYQVSSGAVNLVNAGSASSRPGPGPARPPELPVNSCLIPQNPVTSGITATSATVSWDATPLAVGYLIQGRRVGLPGIQSSTTPVNSRTFGIFQPGTSYEWRVAASCDGVNVSPFSAWNPFTTASFLSREEPAGLSAWTDPAPVMLGVYPVPFRDRFGIHFGVEGSGAVSSTLFDLQGRQVQTWDLGTLHPGGHFREFQVPDLPSGTYLLKLCAGNECSERQVQRQ
jgi:alkaline phosphatase D